MLDNKNLSKYFLYVVLFMLLCTTVSFMYLYRVQRRQVNLLTFALNEAKKEYDTEHNERVRELTEYRIFDYTKLTRTNSSKQIENDKLLCKDKLNNDNAIEIYLSNSIYTVFVIYNNKDAYTLDESNIIIFNKKCEEVRKLTHEEFKGKNLMANSISDAALYNNKLMVNYHINPN